MEKKNLTLVFPYLAEEHLGKDVFLVPYYLGKKNNLEVDILCSPNKDMRENIRGVNIIQIPFNNKSLSSFYLSRNVLKHLLFNSKKINVLMEFHITGYVLLSMFIYKVLNRHGLSYLKADGGDFFLQFNSLSRLKKFFYKTCLKKIDVISIETKVLYDDLVLKYPEYKDKFIYIPNGFDEDYLKELNIEIKEISEKENLIITVGRLGTYLKNTEMVLDSVKELDLKDWKVLLIGPIEKEEQNFQKSIDDFFIKYPHLKDKIIFTGPIYDKKALWEYYNRAKVFILTSRREGFAIVYGEAYRFCNYIVTTNVGGAKDILQNGYGKIVNDEIDLENTMQAIIDGSVNLEELYMTQTRFNLSWENLLEELSCIMKEKYN